MMKPIMKKYSTLQAGNLARLGLSYLTANRVRPETQLNYSHALDLLLGWRLLKNPKRPVTAPGGIIPGHWIF